MKIYGSTQYVNPSEVKEWYSLEVINQWDWKKQAICFKQLSNGILISYCLYKNIAVNETEYKRELVTELNSEIKTELINMGYELK